MGLIQGRGVGRVRRTMTHASSTVAYSGWESLFFVALILSMAIIPLISGAWWRKWFPLVTLALALPCAVNVGFKDAGALLASVEEYTSFILLIGALFIIAGGIDVETPFAGKPATNTLILLSGAVLANVLGTTGASMVLIRPLIRANAWRQHRTHIFVFFIFLVSNMGGMLTPLGDPPLFLGYLQGVPFVWTLTLLPHWAVAVGGLLAAFWVLDAVRYRREERSPTPLAAAARRGFQLHGARNVILLMVVVASLFLPELVRNIVIVLATLVSIKVTPAAIRTRNDFSYHPIIEVAVLFAGIFVAMIPVQGLVHGGGGMAMAQTPVANFWLAGGLSSFLDNAPTYLIFFQAARAAAEPAVALVAGVPAPLLIAISTGCVMMGANTYIGNGPNLMVKAICEEEGIPMPSFLGYMAWAAVILVPLYGVVTLLFFIP